MSEKGEQKNTDNILVLIQCLKEDIQAKQRDYEKKKLMFESAKKELKDLQCKVKDLFAVSFKIEFPQEIDTECKICMHATCNVAFTTCGHIACEACCGTLNNQCHLCRKPIEGFIKLYYN